MERILVTGASGFIGSFIVEEALRRGMDVWAAVRKTSSRRYLGDPRIHFIELDFSSVEMMVWQLRGKTFDYIVHAAGVTKCTDSLDFFRVNTCGTANLVAVVKACKMRIRLMVFMSSLSVFGPAREQRPYTEISLDDEPRPNTAYGRSKLDAEKIVSGSGLPFVILRPTGVYGPRERDYYIMVRSISKHLDFAVGFTPQDLTFVYVDDVVQAVFLAIEKSAAVEGRAYFITDGEVYSSRTFSDLIYQELGRPWRLRLRAPLWLLRAVTSVCGAVSRLTGRSTALNNDKYNILAQRNWRCDIGPATDELGYRPTCMLAAGVRRTIQWYKDNDWL